MNGKVEKFSQRLEKEERRDFQSCEKQRKGIVFILYRKDNIEIYYNSISIQYQEKQIIQQIINL